MENEAGTKSLSDNAALAIATVGVGYLPLAPGTWGSLVGVAIYIISAVLAKNYPLLPGPVCFALCAVLLTLLSLLAFWASKRTALLKRGKDPQIVVIDEVLGQLLTFVFIPFTMSWPLILAGFALFRLFDIWKPFPVKAFEALPEGIGICADDIAAGVYAGVCLSLIFAVF